MKSLRVSMLDLYSKVYLIVPIMDLPILWLLEKLDKL